MERFDGLEASGIYSTFLFLTLGPCLPNISSDACGFARATACAHARSHASSGGLKKGWEGLPDTQIILRTNEAFIEAFFEPHSSTPLTRICFFRTLSANLFPSFFIVSHL